MVIFVFPCSIEQEINLAWPNYGSIIRGRKCAIIHKFSILISVHERVQLLKAYLPSINPKPIGITMHKG